MEWLIVVGIGIVVVVVVAFLVIRRSSNSGDSLDPWGAGGGGIRVTPPVPPSMTGMDAPAMGTGGAGSLPEPLLLELRALVGAGRKIDAIKRLREYTRWDLKTAKDYLDQMSANPGLAAPGGSYPLATSGPVDLLIQANSGIRPAGTGALTEAQLDEIKVLAAANKIAAIKQVREYTGWGLKEAKEYVEALELQVKSEVGRSFEARPRGDQDEEIGRRVRAMVGRVSRQDIVTYLCEDYRWGRDRAEAYVQQAEAAQQEAVAVQSMAALTPEVLDTVRKLTLAGKKIEAIKVVRQATGWGLKEAKDYVEAQRF
jgi:ribosomal protein L7/L12